MSGRAVASRVVAVRPANDAAGFDAFYVASRDRLVLHVAALTGDPVEALDHVQEAFIRAWNRWERISTYDDPEGWVRRVAYNCAVSRWRWSRRLVPLVGPGGRSRQDRTGDGRSQDDRSQDDRSQDDRIQLEDDQLVMIDALRRIPDRERRVVVLHHLLGYSIDEIAAELSAPPGSVKSWLSRGRAKLATQIRAEEAIDDIR